MPVSCLQKRTVCDDFSFHPSLSSTSSRSPPAFSCYKIAPNFLLNFLPVSKKKKEAKYPTKQKTILVYKTPDRDMTEPRVLFMQPFPLQSPPFCSCWAHLRLLLKTVCWSPNYQLWTPKQHTWLVTKPAGLLPLCLCLLLLSLIAALNRGKGTW